MTRLVCPKCGSTEVGSNDKLLAIARGRWVVNANTGEREFNPSGWTEVCWDTQEADCETPCICENCYWSGDIDQLVAHE